MKLTVFAAVFALLFIGCKPGNETKESDNFSGLFSLSVGAGTVLTKDAALLELGKFCSPEALPGYIQRIANKLSFNAGYASHPNAGYDAQIVKKMGPDGKEGFYIGSGQMFDGAGTLAMMPPTNGSVSQLVTGYCLVAMNSLQGGGACAYPIAEFSQGGSVSGSSARGTINSPSCIIAKLQNQQIRHRAEFAFCQDAVGVNFFTSADGAAGEMSAIIR